MSFRLASLLATQLVAATAWPRALPHLHFGVHHLFDGDPHTCWIGGAGAASRTLIIALGDIYRLDELEFEVYAGHGVAALDIAYALAGQRYTPLHEGLNPAGTVRLGGVLATHLRLTLREPLMQVPVIAELWLLGR